MCEIKLTEKKKICRYGLSYERERGTYCSKFEEYRGKQCYINCKDYEAM